jgi:integrase/recombinase XerD
MADPEGVARRYLEHLTVERGLADNTLAAYRRDLERYVGFLRTRKVRALGDVDAKTIRAFIASVSASTHGPDAEAYHATTVSRMLSTVRTFHRFALREGLVDDDPTAGVVRPRLPRALPHPLTVDEVTAIVEAPGDATPAAARDRAILELLYGAGLRVSELVGLDVDDVDLEDASVRVLGKGS